MEAVLVKPPAGERTFIHEWVKEPRKNPEPAIPLSYAKKLGKQIRVAKYSGPRGMERYVEFGGHEYSQIIYIKGSVKGSDMQVIGVYAAEFEDMLRRTLGGGRPSRHYTLRVFGDVGEYRAFSASQGAGVNAMSFYAPRTYEIGTWFVDGLVTHELFQEVLCHEMTHAYMDLVYGVTTPLWFAEGTAEYFQHFKWDAKAKRCVPGQLAQKELRALSVYGGALPIREFVKLKRDAMYGPDFEKLYAQAWATAHWIYTTRPDIAHRLLVTRETVDEPGLEAEFERHLDVLMKKVEWKA